MWYFGLIPAFMSALSFYFSVRHAIKDNYDLSVESEKLCALWLIAALICFK